MLKFKIFDTKSYEDFPPYCIKYKFLFFFCNNNIKSKILKKKSSYCKKKIERNLDYGITFHFKLPIDWIIIKILGIKSIRLALTGNI